MNLMALGVCVLGAALASASGYAQEFERDTISTEGGELTMTFIGHGTLMFEYGGNIIHVDPVSREADYEALPDADLILVTHEHGDHLDANAIRTVTKDGTVLVLTETCAGQLGNPNGAVVMKNGDSRDVAGFAIEAVPAYNIVNERAPGQPFHPKGTGNGYIITFGGTRVYVAGDTENTPEMKALTGIEIAFLPMNLPYTMTPEMVADAARAFKPRILYPYHYGETETARLEELLADVPDIDVRVRALQ